MKKFYDKVAERIDKLDAESRRRQFLSVAGEATFLETILQTLREGVIAVDAEHTVLFANTAAADLAGFDPAKAKGAFLEDILPGWEWRDLLRSPSDGLDWTANTTREVEITYPERRILEVQSTPCAAGVAILLRDITRERSREADTLESGRADAVRDLAAGVAHEIGNPLNALGLNLRILERSARKEPDPARRERLLSDIATALEEVKRIDSINKSFLAALRPVSPDFTPSSIIEPISETLSELKPILEERRISVTLDCPPAIPPVAIDRAQMRQVFFNLVKNAMEAMKDGGEIDIAVASDDRDVTVSILDSGTGLSPDAISHIFEPYRTTKKHGNGLGLMICRRIVRAHGGEIDAESKEGSGTRFIVRLPRLEKRVRRLT
jgi:signal transduction histidine kinase